MGLDWAAFALFVRGAVCGVLATLLLLGLAVWWLLAALDDPALRLSPPSPGDRSSRYPAPPVRTAAGAASATGATGATAPGAATGAAGAQTTATTADAATTAPDTAAAAAAAAAPKAAIPEHDSPWPPAVVAFLRAELAPAAADLPLVAGKPVLRATIDALALASARSPAAAAATSTSAAAASTPAAPSAAADPAARIPASHDSEPVAMGDLEHCHWLNVALHRFFLAFRDSALFKSRWTAVMSSKLNMKLKSNPFVTSIQICDLELGDNCPSITGVRLLKGITSDLAVYADANVAYLGGGSILLQVSLTAGINIPARVYLNRFTGVIRVRAPSQKWPDMIGVAFVEDPGISFVVDAGITRGENDMIRGMVNRLLSSIVRKTFLELWVLPSWRTFFLPQMQPAPEDLAARTTAAAGAPGSSSANSTAAAAAATAFSSASKDLFRKTGMGTGAAAGTSSAAKKTLADRATALWESRLLRTSKLASKDLLQGVTFDLDTPMTPFVDTRTTDDMEASLVTAFLGLVNEPLDSLPAPAAPPAATPNPSSTPPVATAAASAATTAAPGSAAAGTADADQMPDTGATGWRTVRNKAGIHIQKRFVAGPPPAAAATAATATTGAISLTDMVRAVVTIACDAERVARVLSNPEHFGHVYESFDGSEFVHDYENGSKSIISSRFRFGRSSKSFLAFSVSQLVGSDPAEGVHGPTPANMDGAASEADAGDARGGVEGDSKGRVDQALHLARVVVMRSIGSFQSSPGLGAPSLSVQAPPSETDTRESLQGEVPGLDESTGDMTDSESGFLGLGQVNPMDSVSVSGAGSDSSDTENASAADRSSYRRHREGEPGASLPRPRSMSLGKASLSSSSEPLDVPHSGRRGPRAVVSSESLTARYVSQGAAATARIADAWNNLTSSPYASQASIAQPSPPASSFMPNASPAASHPDAHPTPEQAAAGTTAKPFADVYVFGYHIAPAPEDPENASRVTIVSHFSYDLRRLEVDYNTCRRLKQFIEELDQFTRGMNDAASISSGGGMGSGEPSSEMRRRRRLFSFGSGGAGSGSQAGAGDGATASDGRRIEKLRNYLGSTASYLMKGGKALNATWLSGRVGPAGSAGGSYQPSPGRHAGGKAGNSGPASESDTDGDAYADRDDGDGGTDANTLRAADGAADALDRGVAGSDETRQMLFGSSSAAGAPALPHRRKRQSADVSATAATERHSGQSTVTATGERGSVDFAVIAPRRSLIMEMTEFDREPYIERMITSKDAVRVEIPFHRPAYGPGVVLEWEFMTRSEFHPRFSIQYTPDAMRHTAMAKLLPMSPSSLSSRLLFPATPLQSYTSPAYGSTSVSSLDSGVFVITWDAGSSSQAKKMARSFAYKCLVHNLDTPPVVPSTPTVLDSASTATPVGKGSAMGMHVVKHGVCAEATVARMAYVAVPLIYDESLTFGGDQGGSGHGHAVAPTRLQWEFTTGAYDVTFAVYFDPVDPAAAIHQHHEQHAAASLSSSLSSSSLAERDLAVGASQDPSAEDGSELQMSQLSQADEANDDLLDERRDVAAAAPPPTAWEGDAHEQAHETQEFPCAEEPSDAVLRDELERMPPPIPPRSNQQSPALPDRPSLSSRLAAAVGTNAAGASDRSGSTSIPAPGAPHVAATQSGQAAGASPPRPTVKSLLASRLVAAARSTASSAITAASQSDLFRGANTGARQSAAAGDVHGAGSSAATTAVSNEFLATGTPHRQCLVPPTRVNSNRGSVASSLDITGRLGVYTLVWDNSTSLMTSRTVGFKIHLVTVRSGPASTPSAATTTTTTTSTTTTTITSTSTTTITE
ncbi:hypothetical protein BC831DRAFT_486021 [Entophlyctis helioformis]|nr:hypothetical protein BC831DRAFT_486021 [Entophlyctis helioformis]